MVWKPGRKSNGTIYINLHNSYHKYFSGNSSTYNTVTRKPTAYAYMDSNSKPIKMGI